VIIVAYKKVASSLVKLLVSTSEVYNVSPEIITPKSSLLIIKIDSSESITLGSTIRSIANLSIPTSEVYNVSPEIIVPKSSLLIMKIDPFESITFGTTIKSIANLSIPTSETYNVSVKIVPLKSSLLIMKIDSSESIAWTTASAYPSSVALSVIIPLETTVVSDRVFEALANLKLVASEETIYTPPPPPSGATVILKVVVGEAQLARPLMPQFGYPSVGVCGTFGVCIDAQDYYSGYVNPPYDYVRVSPFYTMGVLDTPASGSTPYSELAIDYLTTKDYA